MDTHCIYRTKHENIGAYIAKNPGPVVIYGAAFWGLLLEKSGGVKADFFCDRKAAQLRLAAGVPVIDIHELQNIINERGRATIIICVETKGTVVSICRSLMQKDLNADVFHYFENEHVFCDSAFVLGGKKYDLFEHPYNCGYIQERMTERSVELALAREFIDNCNDRITEIGAVTPYYFYEGKISEIIDPTDIHARATAESLFDCNLKAKNVISISTVEHIGTSDYGMHERQNAADAIEKIIEEAESFLITAPLGYNGIVDQWVADHQKNEIVKLLKRNINNHWEDITGNYEEIAYTHLWANGLAVIYKRGISNGTG